jgi:hypothetical protein
MSYDKPSICRMLVVSERVADDGQRVEYPAICSAVLENDRVDVHCFQARTQAFTRQEIPHQSIAGEHEVLRWRWPQEPAR